MSEQQKDLLIKQLKNKLFQRDLRIAYLLEEIDKLKTQVQLSQNSQMYIN